MAQEEAPILELHLANLQPMIAAAMGPDYDIDEERLRASTVDAMQEANRVFLEVVIKRLQQAQANGGSGSVQRKRQKKAASKAAANAGGLPFDVNGELHSNPKLNAERLPDGARARVGHVQAHRHHPL